MTPSSSMTGSQAACAKLPRELPVMQDVRPQHLRHEKSADASSPMGRRAQFTAWFATAALLGVLVPWMLRPLRIDTAIDAGPLVTATCDRTATSISDLVALFLISS